MKILALSDLHFEFHKDAGKSFVKSLDATNVDVVVLAGDISVGYGITNALGLFAKKFSKVIYVHGNHEYYNGHTQEVIKATEESVKNNDNIVWLNNSVAEIDGVRFIGTPMWFKRNNLSLSLKRWITDFRLIENCDPWVFDENEKAIKFLNEEVRKGDVVVTHHLPTEMSVHAMYAGDPTNCFFLCDVEELILERCPKLWIHGHTHFSFDYTIDHCGTRVVCNPFGYVRRQENKDFIETKIIEI